MSVATRLSDLRVLARLARGLPDDGGTADRLAAFYGPQARDYDRFRDRLLQGRDELVSGLQLESAAHLVEFGAGTGQLMDRHRHRLATAARLDLVDLCEPLLAQARQRFAADARVTVHHADAASWQPPQPADRVLLSYALSMIPHWYAVVDNAARCLSPDGLIGVIDFQVAPRGGSRRGFRQGRLARHLWPWWFDHDGVRLSPDLLGYLEHRFEAVDVRETSAALPYLPGLRVPCFRFIGRSRPACR